MSTEDHSGSKCTARSTRFPSKCRQRTPTWSLRGSVSIFIPGRATGQFGAQATPAKAGSCPIEKKAIATAAAATRGVQADPTGRENVSLARKISDQSTTEAE